MINIYRMNFCAKVLNSVQICFHLGAFFILIKGLKDYCLRKGGIGTFSADGMLYM